MGWPIVKGARFVPQVKQVAPSALYAKILGHNGNSHHLVPLQVSESFGVKQSRDRPFNGLPKLVEARPLQCLTVQTRRFLGVL